VYNCKYCTVESLEKSTHLCHISQHNNCLSVCLSSVCQSVCPSVCLSVCLSVCQPRSQGLSSWGGKMRDPGNEVVCLSVCFFPAYPPSGITPSLLSILKREVLVHHQNNKDFYNNQRQASSLVILCYQFN